jgi:hypothetical protein
LIAYAFLHPGRVGQFADVPWPEPGAWLEADVDSCPTVIHAALPNGLPVWLAEELWEVELGGEIVLAERHAVAERGRLVRRIEAWNDETARRFGEACAAEARRRVATTPELAGYADDAEAVTTRPPVAAYMTARLAELQDGPDGYDAERDRQARWLRDALALI